MLGHPAARAGEPGEVDGAEAVERRPAAWPSPAGSGGRAGRAGRRGRPPGLGQRRRGGQPAVDVGPAPAVGRDDPGQHQLLVVVDEATLDHGLGSRPGAPAWRRPGRRPAGRCASTSIVLPAPVSPVSAVMPGPSTRESSAMTPEVAGSAARSASAVAQPELGLEDPVEVRSPNRTKRATSVGAATGHDVALGQHRRRGDRRRRPRRRARRSPRCRSPRRGRAPASGRTACGVRPA